MTDVMELLWKLMWWFIGLGIHICLITVTIVVSTWSLLFICRLLGIPWIDGTTKGYIKRE